MKQISLKYGIIAGVAVVGYMLLFYLIDKSVMLGWQVYWSSLIIYLACMYKACLAQRTANGGLLTFRDALRTAFVTFLIANAIFFFFYYILFNVMDPGLVALQKEAARELYTSIMGREEAQKMITAMEEEGFDMTITTTVQAYAKGTIGGFLLSLIIAALTKRLY